MAVPAASIKPLPASIQPKLATIGGRYLGLELGRFFSRINRLVKKFIVTKLSRKSWGWLLYDQNADQIGETAPTL
jgi:hypothetical protein